MTMTMARRLRRRRRRSGAGARTRPAAPAAALEGLSDVGREGRRVRHLDFALETVRRRAVRGWSETRLLVLMLLVVEKVFEPTHAKAGGRIGAGAVGPAYV